MGAAATPAKSAGQAAPGRFTGRQRCLLWLIERAGYAVVRVLGRTLRFAVSWEEGSPPSMDERPLVYSFWHACMIPAMYLWRDRQVRVMSSDSFDGEYTGRIMQRFGFVKVRGSSSRFAVRALLGMKNALAEGWVAAFTLDGPRGPRYVAKPGPVLLAGSTGAPMVAFHIALNDAWVLNTWDQLMIPKPFSKALMRVSRRMPVPPDASDLQKQQALDELQAALDRVRQFAEAHVARAGSAEFPFFVDKS